MSKAKIIVLGAGRVGRVIARDLAEDPGIEVTVADRRSGYLEEIAANLKCATLSGNLSETNVIAERIAGFDLVVGALPGCMGLATIQAAIRARIPCVDISFLPEDPRSLDRAAKDAGVPVLYDFGVAPGMSNLLTAREARRFEDTRHVGILVGGLPRLRQQPWEYAAPFSPADIIEEYVRAARIKINGQIVQRPALSGMELVDFPEIGTLEAFHTDGLRSLLDTVACPSMEEKTLRYPGHADRIRLLRDAGFLSMESVDVNGIQVVPRELTLRLLEPAWFLSPETDEFTVMRIIIVAGSTAPYKRIIWQLFDQTDRQRGETSMARTTGFPAAIAARRLLDGTAALPPGVHPPEAVSADESFFSSLLADLNARGVHYARSET